MNNIFNIFVASSLSLSDERQAVSELIQELNSDVEYVEKLKATFTDFRYETSKEVLQAYDEQGAQTSINEILYQSAFFVLICDGVIGEKSREEFERACNRFKNKRFPAYIYVMYKDYSSCLEDCPKPSGDQISFGEFEERYNRFSRYDKEIGETVHYNKIYAYPYQNCNDIKKKLRYELEKALGNDYSRPLIDAKLGREIKREDFYSDSERLRHCSDPRLYFKRDFDDDIISAFEEGKEFIYIHGKSLSGKTRAVFQITQRCPDVWFYIFKSYADEGVIEKIKEIAAYVGNFKINQKLCIVFDDLDSSPLFDETSSDRKNEFTGAFDDLMKSVSKHNNQSPTEGGCSVIFTGGTDQDTLPGSIDRDKLEHILIPDLLKHEVVQACRYFKVLGENIGDENKTYRTTGALLIDLNGIKAEYKNWLGVNPLRQRILYAIKVQSKWRRRNLGNIEYIRAFTEYKSGNPFDGKTEDEFYKSLDELCAQCRGITFVGKDNLNIEEYVYRYVIGNDNVLPTRFNCEELNLVGEIMEYCSSRKRQEPLIVTAGKLVKRSDNPKEIVEDIYEACTTEDSLSGWKKELRAEFKDAVSNWDSGDEQIRKAYSRIFRFKIYASSNFDEALEVFNFAVDRYDELMLSALIKKADGKYNDTIEGLWQYKEAESLPWISLRRSMMEDTFSDAYNWIKRCNLPESDSDKELVPFYISAMEHLLDLASSVDELDNLVEELRNNFEFILPSECRNNYFASGSKGKKSLTMFDVFARFRSSFIYNHFKRLIGNSRDNECDFITGYFLPMAIKSCENNVTPKRTIRHIGTLIAGAILDSIDSEIPYEIVLNDVFLKLKFNYVGKDGQTHTMKMWNGYLYNKMMKRKDCDYWKASELFSSFLVPQLHDEDNYTVVTHYILNTLVQHAQKVNSSVLRKKTLDLFDQYGVSRDTYTFNLMLQHAGNLEEGQGYLRQMLECKLLPDNFTLTSFLEPIKDIYTLIAHLGLPKEITCEVELPGLLGGDPYLIRKLDEAINKSRDVKTFIKESVRGQEYAWDMLFKKKCKDEREAGLKRSILNYMENDEDLRNFLKRSTIYSYCLEDPQMIPSVEDALDLLKSVKEKKLVTKIDSYIYSEVLSVCKRQNPVNFGILNEIYKDIYNDLTDDGDYIYCLNKRLEFFGSQTESQPCLLPKDQDVKRLTPVGFIKEIVAKDVKINDGTIFNFLKIKQGMSVDFLAELIGICRDLEGVRFKAETVNRLLSTYSEFLNGNGGICDNDNTRYLEEVFNSFSASERNKQIACQYSGKDSEPSDFADRICRDNVLSATVAYNSILHKYLSSLRKEGSLQPDFFNIDILGYYDKYYKGTIVPTAETISILASCATNMDQVRKVVQIAKAYKDSITRVSAHCFTSMIHVANSYNDILEIFGLYCSLNGEDSPRLLSPLINCIQRCSANKDTDCDSLMSVISGYLFPDAVDGSSPLYNDTELNGYKNQINILKHLDKSIPENIDIYIIRSILRFYSEKGKSLEPVFNVVFDRYRHICGERVDNVVFVESIATDGYIKIDTNTRYRLYLRSAEANPKTYIRLQFAKELVENIKDWDQYVSLMNAFILTEPVWFARIVPALFDILYKHRNKDNDNNSSRFNEIWCRINCYAPLQRLYFGHFLPEGNNVAFSDPWKATKVADSVGIYNERKIKYARGAVTKVLYDIEKLVDAYYVALWFLANENSDKLRLYFKKNEKNEPTLLCKKIHDYEDRYVQCLRDHTLRPSLRNLMQMPLYWDAIKYTPGQDIVLEIISILVELTNDCTYENSAAARIVEVLRKIYPSNKKLPDRVRLPLAYLNKAITGNGFVLLSSQRLLNTLSSPSCLPLRTAIIKN